MSYGFSMCFKQVKNKKDAYEFANEFTKCCKKNALEMIKLHRYSIPTYSKKMFGEEAYECNEIDRLWVDSLFNIRFVYWEKYKLLGIVGEHYPKECMKMVDNYIYFQNATDQDYSFDEWSNKIFIFKVLKFFGKHKNYKKEYKKEDNQKEYTIEEFIDNFDYYKRSCLYKKIFETLELGLWLYGKDGNFERFVMGGIDGQNERLDMGTNLRIVLLELKEENLKDYGHI